MHERGNTDYHGRPKGRACNDVSEPVHIEIYAAHGHDEREPAGNYLVVPAPRSRRNQHYHKAYCQGSADDGVPGRERESTDPLGQRGTGALVRGL